MGLDFEDIQKGRRRDWDKLRDPREVREEQRTKREEDPEYQARASAMRMRDQSRRLIRERDMEEWQRTKRRLLVLGALAGAALLVFTTVRVTVSAIASHRHEARMAELRRQLDAGEVVIDLSDPWAAYTSWRSAWERRDSASIMRVASNDRQRRMRGRYPHEAYVSHFQGELDLGKFDADRSIATRFENPETVQMPRQPWRLGDLAVFKSAPLAREGVNELPLNWIVAFSFDEGAREWRQEELRLAVQWRDSWTKSSQISNLPMPGGYTTPQ